MSTESYIGLRRLQDRYADIVTRRAWPELAEIFRPDCRLDLDLGDRVATYAGPAEVGAFIGNAISGFSFFQFVILNTVIEIDDPAGVAAARMYMHEMRVGRDDGRRTDAYGVYHDRFERDGDERWWFARRRYASFSRTAPAGAAADQVVFPLPEIDLQAVLADV